jgi:hypothetical protein
MRKTIAFLTLGSLVAFGLFGPLNSTAEAAKPKKKSAKYQEVAPPAPVPFHQHDGVVEHSVVVDAGVPCCEHKCCKKKERKCHHECAPACPPTVEYKGCPAPCSVEKVVSVTHPKTCCTIEVVVQVPANACEKIDRDRDGDVEFDYGKYEVSLNWKDGGRRLVVHYDD